MQVDLIAGYTSQALHLTFASISSGPTKSVDRVGTATTFEVKSEFGIDNQKPKATTTKKATKEPRRQKVLGNKQ